ncbi:MAG: phosphoketolase, partial [Gemmatimonadaceae bacterium]
MTQTRERLDQLQMLFRAANYLSHAELYLCDNALLRRPLEPRHIKKRLLGHWGTVPGINLVYAHLNRLIQDTSVRALYVVGTGHGAPGVLANVYLEGTLTERYPEYALDETGLNRFVRAFSWPGGFPSHVTALTPGSLHEGGELGYSLAHAAGAALDDPDLFVTCLIGDGEAETGPLAAAWHSHRFMNPASDGMVLPILHLNGYKLSGPSILARFAERELREFFTGMGYEPREVAGHDPLPVHREMWSAMDWAHGLLRERQAQARAGHLDNLPRPPVIILRTPK